MLVAEMTPALTARANALRRYVEEMALLRSLQKTATNELRTALVGVQDVTAVQTVVWWAQVMQLQSVAALVFLPLVISPVDRIPGQCALPWVPVPSQVIKHVNSNNPSKGCLTLGCNDSV